jgi:hypothetical protein
LRVVIDYYERRSKILNQWIGAIRNKLDEDGKAHNVNL